MGEDERKCQLDDLFKDFLARSDILLSPGPESVVRQHRVFVGITQKNEREPLTSNISEFVSASPECYSKWFIESITPIVLMSSELREHDRSDLTGLLTVIAGSSLSLRLVAGSGPVEFGRVGAGRRMGIGSVGQIVSDVLLGCFTLPFHCSWADEDTCKDFQFQRGALHQVVDRCFYQLP
jgi:hypothetical protein